MSCISMQNEDGPLYERSLSKSADHLNDFGDPLGSNIVEIVEYNKNIKLNSASFPQLSKFEARPSLRMKILKKIKYIKKFTEFHKCSSFPHLMSCDYIITPPENIEKDRDLNTQNRRKARWFDKSYDRHCVLIERNPKTGFAMTIAVDKQSKNIYVSSMFPDCILAEKLMVNDIIYAVDDEKLSGMSLNDVTLKIKTTSGLIKIVYERPSQFPYYELNTGIGEFHKTRRSLKERFKSFVNFASSRSFKGDKAPHGLHNIQVLRQADGNFGFTLIGDKKTKNNLFERVFVKKVETIKYAKPGRLHKGDQLVSINYTSVSELSKEEVVEILLNVKTNILDLYIQR